MGNEPSSDDVPIIERLKERLKKQSSNSSLDTFDNETTAKEFQ